MEILSYIQTTLTEALQKLELPIPDVIEIEHPADPQFGDYSSSVALKLFGQVREQGRFSNPRALAQAIVEAISLDSAYLDQVSLAGPGFINFKLSPSYLTTVLESTLNKKFSLPNPSQQAAVVEYMQPNTNKPLHIGHLRNTVLGQALIELLKRRGWQVSAATINNDRGLHIIKSMWGYLKLAHQVDAPVVEESWQSVIAQWQENPHAWQQPAEMAEPRLQKPDHFVGHWYVQADAYAETEAVQKEWQAMLQAWENSDDEQHESVRSLWKQMNAWFYQGYEQSNLRLGTHFDQGHISYESEIYQEGKQIILENLEKGIFRKKENGAVFAELSEFKLPDKVLLRSDGTGIYMTFDIALTKQRSQTAADKLVWVVGDDQRLYFQQLFAIAQKLGFGDQNRFRHFSYGMVRLPEGKMSSRKGTVIYADDLVDMAVHKATEIMSSTGVLEKFTELQSTEVAEQVGLGAIKWSMLSVDPLATIAFDIDQSVSFSGNSGPYVQYTNARCQAVLRKAKTQGKEASSATTKVNDEESALLRWLERYPETISRAADNYAPHLLSTYLFELAKRFNTFYNKHSILTDSEHSEFRIALTQATSAVIEDGLALLRIAAPAQM